MICRTPEKRQSILDRKGRVKALGDKLHTYTSQTIGMLSGTNLVDDLDDFVRLAKGYIFEGQEREELCTYNANVRFLFSALMQFY